MDRKPSGPFIQFGRMTSRLLRSLLVLLIVHELSQFSTTILMNLLPSETTRTNLLLAAAAETRPRPRGSSMPSGSPCQTMCRCQDRSASCRDGGLDVVPITLNPRLEWLDLSDNHIKRFSVSSLHGVYPYLKRLNLSRNEISQLPPDAFGSNLSLEILNLDGNNITSLPIRSLSGLPKLRTLTLTGNRIANLSGPVFERLTTLEALDIGNNRISHMSVAAFEGLKSLRTLSLRHNQIGRLMRQTEAGEYETISSGSGWSTGWGTYDPSGDNEAVVVLMSYALSPDNLPNLTRLDLGRNGIQIIARRWSPFAARCGDRLLLAEAECDKPSVWTELKELFLDGSLIETIEPGSFSGLSSLLVLKLNDNSLTEIPYHLFKDVSSTLEVLEIGQNRFRSIEEGAFSWLGRLRRLDISDCPNLQSIKSNAFRGLTNLERLDLSRNPGLHTLDAQLFDDLPNLKYLFLRGNNFSGPLDENWVQLGMGLTRFDFRDNGLRCDCSAEPLQRLLIDMKNRTVQAIEFEKFISQMDSARLQRAALSTDGEDQVSSPTFEGYGQRHQYEFLLVRCEQPGPLNDQLLINLDIEAFGCDASREWLTIKIAAIIVAIIALVCLSVAAVCAIIRYRRRQIAERCSRWHWKGTTVVDSREHTLYKSQRTLPRNLPMIKPPMTTMVGTYQRNHRGPAVDHNSIYYIEQHHYENPDHIIGLHTSEKINLNIPKTPNMVHSHSPDNWPGRPMSCYQCLPDKVLPEPILVSRWDDVY